MCVVKRTGRFRAKRRRNAMKKKDVAVGGTYAAKVSGKVVDVRIDA